MTLDEVFEDGQRFAKSRFESQHEIMPMWIGRDDNGCVYQIVVRFSTDDEKDAAIAKLKEIFREHNITKYVSILESWVIEPKVKEVPKSIRLGARVSDHPDRREVIWITAENKAGERRSGMFYILRPEHGEPTLSPFKDLGVMDKQEGRFANLLSTETNNGKTTNATRRTE